MAISFRTERLSQTSGWVAPNGKFFTCSSYKHDACADDLGVRFYPREMRHKTGTRVLEEKYWVRLSSNGIFRVGPDMKQASRITQSQLDLLFDLAVIDRGSMYGRNLLLQLQCIEEG